jgi:hypothetical protein
MWRIRRTALSPLTETDQQTNSPPAGQDPEVRPRRFFMFGFICGDGLFSGFHHNLDEIGIFFQKVTSFLDHHPYQIGNSHPGRSRWPSLFVSVLLVSASSAFLLVGSMAFGYVTYGLSHFIIHHTRFRRRLARRWAANHHIHHYHPDTNFGVTTLLWDTLLNTRYVRP